MQVFKPGFVLDGLCGMYPPVEPERTDGQRPRRSVATAPSTESPKNVLTTCRIVERCVLEMWSDGEYT